MTTGDKWVRMTPEEYMEYKRGRVANETAYKEGYDKGIRMRSTSSVPTPPKNWSWRMTRTETTQLKPCPFCGKEARVTRNSFDGRFYCECSDDNCEGYWGMYRTESEAIASWNTRAERTCENTARHKGYGFTCSECGGRDEEPNDYGNSVYFSEWEFCPHCGAKVVSE